MTPVVAVAVTVIAAIITLVAVRDMIIAIRAPKSGAILEVEEAIAMGSVAWAVPLVAITTAVWL